MPTWQLILEATLGTVIVAAIMADIFATILVPGPVGGRLRVIVAVRSASLPLSRRAARRRPGRGRRPSRAYAPASLALTFGAWMLLLLAGFGMLIHAAGALFHPHIVTFADALWVAGSSLMTLGVSEYDADGVGRWLILVSALSGFSALTATVTFMLQIQSGLHQREPLVMTLPGLAGTPPSGVAILQSFAELGDRDELLAFFRTWRDWAASTLHTHLSYPILNYYRSIDPQSDWLAALEAVLDAATLLMTATDDPAGGTATLMHRTGSRTAKRLRALFALSLAEVTDNGADDDDAAAAIRLLREAGYRGPDVAEAARTFRRLRADYAGEIEALARHMGADRAVLLPGEG